MTVMMMRHKKIFALFGKSEMNQRHVHQLLGKSPATRRINESRKSAVCRVTLRRKKKHRLVMSAKVLVMNHSDACQGSFFWGRWGGGFFLRDSFEIKPVGVRARADRMSHVLAPADGCGV